MRIDPRLIGFTAHREHGPLSKPTHATFSIRRSLDPLRPSSSFLTRLLFRVPSFVHLAAHLAMFGFTCPWVSFPLRDITRARLRLFAEPPTLHFGPSAGFRNLSTASSALELTGLFHPAATSRVRSSFRGFSPAAATFPLRKELASLPLFHRCSYPSSDFRRLPCTSTNDASRLRGFSPRQAAFLRSGYSPRPKPLPSSNSTLLQVLALSTPASALTVAVRS
jgi:hypothetical protein